MIRIDNPPIAKFLKEDFLFTCNGKNQSTSKRFEGIEFHLFIAI